MEVNFPGSKIESQQYCSSQFLIPTEYKISSIFTKMGTINKSMELIDYSIVQSTLDQVWDVLLP